MADKIKELEKIGFASHDALFPGERQLVPQRPDHQRIDPMRTEGAASRAFEVASSVVGQRYTPHSVRDCLAALGEQLCRTAATRKAWSLNLGHETEEITRKHYGKMSDCDRSEIITSMRNEGVHSMAEERLMLEFFFALSRSGKSRIQDRQEIGFGRTS